MPGISLLYHNKNFEIQNSFDYLLYENDYSIKILFENSNIILLESSYKGYPITHFETERFVYVIEGLIYNHDKNHIKTTLLEITKTDIKTLKNSEKLKSFIENADGEFIVYIIDKETNDYFAFGDKWGRLKAYLYHDKNMSMISRDHPFIIENIPKISIDHKAVSEFIVFEYYLNNKTLVSNVFKTKPRFLVTLHNTDKGFKSEVSQTSSIQFNTNNKISSFKSIVKNYSSAFSKSLDSRIKTLYDLDYNFTSDLSGGLDSRAIFFALSKYDIDVKYFTDKLISGDESFYAIKVGEIYDKKVNIVKTNRNINIPEMKNLTYITGCNVNSITTLSCYQDAKERKNMTHAPCVKFGGLGGSYLRDVFKNVHGYNYVISKMIKDNIHVRGLSVELASKVLNINHKDFYTRISDYFDNYPEKKPEDRLKHFYFDYNNNVVNMGEERARMNFWTIQPFLTDSLYNTFSSTPLKYINFPLFINFMKEIDSKSFEPKLYNYNVNLKNKYSLFVYHIKCKCNHFIRHNRYIRNTLIMLRKHLSKKSKSLYVDDKIIENTLKIINDSKILPSIFNKEELISAMKQKNKIFDIKPLISAILYINYLEEHYKDKLDY